MSRALHDQYPLRLFIGREDVTFLADSGLTFSNVDPGGYEAASLEIGKDMPQSLRGQRVRIDTGLRLAWEGRISEVQRSLGNKTAITCEGFGALLKDSETAQIFVDRDLTQWQGPSVQRQIDLVVGGISGQGPSVAADASTGNPSLVAAFTGPWSTGGLPECEALYDAQGIPLAFVSWAWDSLNIDLTDTRYSLEVLLATTDRYSTFDASANLINGVSSVLSGTTSATAANRVFAALLLEYSAAGGAANEIYSVFWQNLAVYGRHGLPLRGAAPYGFYPSDIAQFAALLAADAPGLALGIVPDMTNYVVPHSVYYTPVTLDQIVGDMSVAAGWHWGVWENLSYLTGSQQPRFDFRPRPADGAFTASCRRQDCDTLDIREDLSGLYNVAVVAYTDVTGLSRSITVGIDNPLLDQVGLTRTVILNGGTMTAATATVFGQLALILLLQQARVSGSIEMSTGLLDGPGAPWLLKSGIDRLRIVDLPSSDAWGSYNDVPITRVECSVSDSAISTAIEVGSGADLVETLQARLLAASTLAGQGGV